VASITEQLTAALEGRYIIEREIGAGGMATVYLARDVKHNRHVALKVLKPDLAAVIGTERFFSEIQLTANLQHPHLLPLFDSGEANGLLFYVMPYVEGETLRQRLDRERQLSVDEAVHIAAAVASAVDYAHRHGVIHRDLKPENILLHEREPLVMDFGIALAVSNAGGARVTQTGISLGTPQYMSPEQATGDRVIDARTDVYALGAVLYEMLTGDPPHAGNTVQAIIARILTDSPKSIRATRETVPEYVERAVMCALAKLPADRFATAADFAEAITGAAPVTAALVAQDATRSDAVTIYAESGISSMFTPRMRALGVATVAVAAVLGTFLSRGGQGELATRQARFVIDLPPSFILSATTAFSQIAISQDGQRVAVWSGGASGPRIMTRRLSELDFDPVAGTDSATSVGMSPDGRHLFFWSSPAPRKLFKIAIEGGAPVKIADSANSASQATWGDNDQVIFTRTGRLFLASADGGAERLLAEPDTSRGQLALGWPVFLPGSKAALISITRPGGAAQDSVFVGVVSIKDGAVHDLGLRGFTPHYSLGRILYVDPTGQLFGVPFDASRMRVTGAPRVIAEGVRTAVSGTDIAVSSNGTVLYTDGGPRDASGGATPERGVVMFDRSGKETELDVPPRNYADLRVSPDGERIALSALEGANATSPTDIYILHRATGQTERFTRNGLSSQPVWTRDGKRIVYRLDKPGRAAADASYISEPWDHSGPPEQVVGAEGAEYLELGPAGGYMAQVRADSSTILADTQIEIAPMDSAGAHRPFAATSMRERWPRMSPDGKWLAYHAHEVGDDVGGRGRIGGAQVSPARVYISPVPGPGARVQLSKDLGNTPMWSADSRTLYYVEAPGAGLGGTLVGARLGTSGFSDPQRDELFALEGRGPGRGGPGSAVTANNPISFASADMSPTGEFFFIRNPTLPGAIQVRAIPNLVAIVNWHGVARQSATTGGGR
jgi:serine/threonine-protein kinase